MSRQRLERYVSEERQQEIRTHNKRDSTERERGKI